MRVDRWRRLGQPHGRGMALTVLACAAFIAYCIGVAYLERRQPNGPRVSQGVLDLSQWTLADNGPVMLDGDWEFYWESLLPPSHFAAAGDTSGSQLVDDGQNLHYITVPRPWNGYDLSGRSLSGYGYATLRMVILPGRNTGMMAISVPYMSTAYRLYVNDRLVASNGEVGTSRETSSPQYAPRVAHFEMSGEPTQLVLQVSNFDHRRGGVWQGLELGTDEQIGQAVTRKQALDVFLFGSMLITSLYHFGLYLLYRRETTPLYFSLLSVVLAIRTVLLGEVMVSYFIPGFSWEIQVKAEYLTMCLILALYSALVGSLYPKETNRGVAAFFYGSSAAFTILVLFTPARVFSQLLWVYQIVLLAAFVYYPVVMLAAARRGRTGAVTFLAASVFVFAFVLNNVLYYDHVVQRMDLIPLGAFAIILVQSLIIGQKYRVANLMATVDPLTDAYNRYYLYAELDRQIDRMARDGFPLAVALVDLDNFKQFNDSYGHLAGDELLRTLGTHLVREVGRDGFVARYGGDEFIIVLPGFSSRGAAELVSSLSQRLRSSVLTSDLGVTMSVGVASYPEDAESVSDLLGKADGALYVAKVNRDDIREWRSLSMKAPQAQ